VGQVVGDILPMAIGVAISVVPIIAIILMLITPKARSNGPAFLAGWILGLAIVGGVVLVIANVANVSASRGSSTVTDVLKLVFGLLFLLLAAKQWRGRPKPGESPHAPKWMATIDGFTPGKAVGLAALLSGVNPKNLVLTVSAAATIAQADVPGWEQGGALFIFIVLASVGIIAPLIVYFAMGEKAAAILDTWKLWLGHHNSAIMVTLFVVFGVLLVGKGIAGLTT
jgi:hypothetical protein